MMKQRMAALLLAGLMLLSLSACGGGDSSSGDKEGAYKMSVILKTTASEHWQLIMAGCRKFESEHPDVVIDITGPANETSYDDQQNMIETTLNNSEVDAIIIAPPPVGDCRHPHCRGDPPGLRPGHQHRRAGNRLLHRHRKRGRRQAGGHGSRQGRESRGMGNH